MSTEDKGATVDKSNFSSEGNQFSDLQQKTDISFHTALSHLPFSQQATDPDQVGLSPPPQNELNSPCIIDRLTITTPKMEPRSFSPASLQPTNSTHAPAVIYSSFATRKSAQSSNP
jgi:hypothetical protein